MAVDQEKLRAVCRLLESRGLEATPEQVFAWVARVQQRWIARHGCTPECDDICNSVLDGEPVMTAMLHLQFGDAI